MRVILFIFTLLFFGCGKDGATDSTQQGLSPISAQCAEVEAEVNQFLSSEIEKKFGISLEAPEDVLGLNFSVSYSAKYRSGNFSLAMEALNSVLDERFFHNRSMGVEPQFAMTSDGNSDLYQFRFGETEHPALNDFPIFSDYERVFDEGGACETTIIIKGDWKQLTRTSDVSGKVSLSESEDKLTPIPSGRIYFYRIGPGEEDQKFATTISNGEYTFSEGVPAGHYRVEFNEKVSPNFRVLSENYMVPISDEHQANFSLEAPCRWNVSITAKVSQYKKTFLWWGKWREKLNGTAIWGMMPVATVDTCYSKLPYHDTNSNMIIYNYRYNLRTVIDGFPSSPIVKVFKDNEDPNEPLKLYLGLELKDRIDFGHGKTDFFSFINSCDSEQRDAQIEGCVVRDLNTKFEQGEAFSVKLEREIEKETRYYFEIKFTPLF